MFSQIFPWIVVDALVLAVFIYLPVGMSEEAVFGTEVGSEAFRGPCRRILHRYRFSLAAVLLAVETAGLIVSLYGAPFPWLYARLALLVLLSAAAFTLYVFFSHQVKAYELAGASQRFGLSLKTRRMRDYINVPLEIAIAAITVATLLVLAFSYASLPEQLPVKWNAQGEASAWTHKRLAVVFWIPAIAIYLQGALLLVKRGLVGAKMTLPAEHAEEYLRCKEELLATNIEVWDWMRGLSAVFILLSLGVVFRSLPRLNFLATAINWVTYVCWMLFIVYCSYFGYRLTAVYRRMKAAAGRIHLERPAEAAHWYAGKLIYFNPHDAALFVESLTCPSYTLNFANRRAYLYLALLAGLVWLMF